jgi:hypothetical protein
MPSVGSTATISGDGRNTEDRARRLYTEILADIATKGIRTRSTPHGLGYMWSGNLATIAAKCWPDLTITPGRTGPASKQFLETIKKHLSASKNVVWVQERGQYFVSPEYKEPRVKKKASPAVVDLATESVTERAKRIWNRAWQYCESNNASVETYSDVEFWVCDKPLAFFVKAEFPELCLPAMQTESAFERYRRPFYDLLRATTNAINAGAKHLPGSMVEGEHKWLIRKDWHDSHEAFQTIFPSVEEEPEPEPVVEEPTPEPEIVVESVEVTQEAVEDLPRYALEILTGVVQANANLISENERLEAEVVRLREENASLAQQVAETTDGATILGLLDEVLSGVYEGNIGMGRAFADVEDIVKQARDA